jgi:hypothetical protein
LWEKFEVGVDSAQFIFFDFNDYRAYGLRDIKENDECITLCVQLL